MQVLLECLVFSLVQLDGLSAAATESFLNAWDCSAFALDEICQPHKKPTRDQQRNKEMEGEPIPHHFIPRKPHPNCILSWGLASKSTKTNLPYLLGVYHDSRRPQLTGEVALLKFLAEWENQGLGRPHVTMDSACTNMERSLVLKERCTITGSLSSTTLPYLRYSFYVLLVSYIFQIDCHWAVRFRSFPYIRGRLE